jgi:hypothetical protein
MLSHSRRQPSLDVSVSRGMAQSRRARRVQHRCIHRRAPGHVVAVSMEPDQGDMVESDPAVANSSSAKKVEGRREIE